MIKYKAAWFIKSNLASLAWMAWIFLESCGSCSPLLLLSWTRRCCRRWWTPPNALLEHHFLLLETSVCEEHRPRLKTPVLPTVCFPYCPLEGATGTSRPEPRGSGTPQLSHCWILLSNAPAHTHSHTHTHRPSNPHPLLSHTHEPPLTDLPQCFDALSSPSCYFCAVIALLYVFPVYFWYIVHMPLILLSPSSCILLPIYLCLCYENKF